MSDTDDTDDLLLIAPDEFVSEAEIIESYTNGPYYNIVESLIAEVNKLQNRVNSIETCDQINSSFDTTMDHPTRYRSSDDILMDGYYNSTYSTPQKPRTKYKMNALSPPKPISRFTSSNSPRKKMFNGPDIHNSTTLSNAAQSTITDNNDIVTVNGKVINLAEIENMLEEIEIQKRKTEQRIREKEQSMQKKYAYRTGDDEKTLPMHNSISKVPSTKSSSSHDLSTTLTGGNDDKSSISSSSESSQMTTKHVPLKSSSSAPLRIYENVAMGDGNQRDSDNLLQREVQLLSLKDLWEKRDHNVLGNWKDKLEEEKLRRQHCEDLIQELQTRTLELEERLAVAVEVDKAKDRALLKFYDSWEKFSSGLKSLSDENLKLETEIDDLNAKNLEKVEEYNKKLEHYEAEASKALTLAHSNHEKLTNSQILNKQLEEKLQIVEKQSKDFEERFENEYKKCKQLNDIIVQKEIELTESKNVLSDSRNEVANSKKAIELCQVEFTNMKSQYSQLEELLLEKQTTIKDLEAKVSSLNMDNNNLKTLHEDAKNEVLIMTQKMEQNKGELRDFYQQQVEILVQEKLKEFQAQLDKAEVSLQEEIKKRELSIAKTAATHIQKITEKHNLEIKLVEEKQKEEIKYYQMQMQQAQQIITSQQIKIKQFQERRATLTQQLHKVMEVQWLEALKIINNTKSPYSSTPNDNTIDQLRTLKAKSHNNLEEVLTDPEPINEPKLHDFQQFTETPVSSKIPGKNQKDPREVNDLQKYVNMLLPNPPSSTNSSDLPKDGGNYPKHEETEDRSKTAQTRRLMKPPWK